MGKVNQPSDIISELRELKRRVGELAKRVGLSAAVIAQGGLRIILGGTFRMVNEDDVEVVYFGKVTSGSNTAWGWIFRNHAGAQVFTMSADPDAQFWALRDNGGRIIVSSDGASGVGLGTPWIPLPPPVPPDLASTQSSSFVTVATSWVFLQHPRIKAFLVGRTSAGSGQMRLLVNGVQIGATQNLTTASSGLTIDALVPDWGSSLLPQSSVSVELQLRATSGGGAFAFGAVQRLYGAQS